jgi:hypothetical protein
MHIVIFALTTLGGAIWWWIRMNPRQSLDMAADAVTTARNLPRKLAFRKQTNAHPVEGIDDPRIAICAIGQAFIELDDLPTREQRAQLNMLLRRDLDCDDDLADEIEVLGRWLVGQCQGAEAAITRLGKRLARIDDGASWDQLQNFLTGLVNGTLSTRQSSAIEDLGRKFR